MLLANAVTDTKTTIYRENLVYLNIFRLFLKILVYFQAYKNLHEVGNISFGFAIFFLAPILKWDLGFGSRYRNLVLVALYSEFKSESIEAVNFEEKSDLKLVTKLDSNHGEHPNRNG